MKGTRLKKDAVRNLQSSIAARNALLTEVGIASANVLQ